ncbi:MAG: hypothetical protein LQ338_006700 [Usnochroma carphineum]|nr:MAG: hypothetical protein LQ338_006700 [Usnochroma carphineum]
MSLHGIHRHKNCTPPQLGSLGGEPNKSFYQGLREANVCTDYILAFWQEIQLFDPQKLNGTDIHTFNAEIHTASKVSRAWMHYLMNFPSTKRVSGVRYTKSVREKHDQKSGGQPRMLHLALVRDNDPESRKVDRAVFGFTAPSWTLGILKKWSRDSRWACFTQDEKELYTARRQKPRQRFEDLKAMKDGRPDPVLQVEAIEDLRGVVEGCSRQAIAISFPQIIARNRCFVCRASTNWQMIEEDPLQSPEDREVEDVWKTYSGTSAELACAEVETDVQFDRLDKERPLTQ